jgi:antitoxin MazE
MMITKVQKWGNSQGLRFTKDLLEQAHIEIGDDVQVSVRGGRIVVEPVTKVRGRYKLKELLARIPKGDKAEDLGWGSPVGKEAW